MPKKIVGRPDIQAFVGAIAGRGGKGLFVTTARFTEKGDYLCEEQHIILIDGHKLAQLMIEHGFEVSTRKIYESKPWTVTFSMNTIDEEK